MACSRSDGCVKLTRTDKDLFVVCWFCNNTLHAKCAGITAGAAEDLKDPDKGTFWVCLKCRPIMRNTQKTVCGMRSMLSELTKDYKAMGDKLRDYLDVFGNCDLFQSTSGNNHLTLNLHGVSVSPSAYNASEPVAATSNNNTVNNNELAPVDVTSNNNNVVPAINTAGDTNRQQNVTPAPHSRDSSQASELGVVPASHSRDSIQVSELGVVPAKKELFISRLTPTTSAEDISSYVLKRLPSASISVFKFNFTYEREVSSFKISANNDTFDQIKLSTFWPKGIRVHEFTSRTRRNQRRRPQNPRNNPNFRRQNQTERAS